MTQSLNLKIIKPIKFAFQKNISYHVHGNPYDNLIRLLHYLIFKEKVH